MTDRDEIPEALAALYEAERNAPAPEPDAVRRIRASVEARLAALPSGPPGGGPAAADVSATAAPHAAVAPLAASRSPLVLVGGGLVVGVLLGALGHALWADAIASRSPRHVATPVAPSEPAPTRGERADEEAMQGVTADSTTSLGARSESPPTRASSPGEGDAVDAAANGAAATNGTATNGTSSTNGLPVPPARALGAPAPADATEARAPTTPQARDAQLSRERVLVASARTALARGDAAEALQAIARHARDFPRGLLAEEREALRVRALDAAGRREEARRALDAFVSTWPVSPLRGGLDRALGEDR